MSSAPQSTGLPESSSGQTAHPRAPYYPYLPGTPALEAIAYVAGLRGSAIAEFATNHIGLSDEVEQALQTERDTFSAAEAYDRKLNLDAVARVGIDSNLICPVSEVDEGDEAAEPAGDGEETGQDPTSTSGKVELTHIENIDDPLGSGPGEQTDPSSPEAVEYELSPDTVRTGSN